MTDFITQIDFNILNAIQSIRNPFLDTIMPLITFLGSGGIVWAVTALIMLCFKKSRKTGIVIIVSLLLGLFLSTMGLKNVIARERPYNTEGALLTVRSRNIFIFRRSGYFAVQQKIRYTGNYSCGFDMLYKAVSVCTFSVRRYLRCVVRNIARVLVKLLNQ